MTETASAAVSHQRLRRRKWDVFLNFQRNTSHSFIDRLYEVLTKEQVRVWKDDAERSNHELVEEAMEDSVAFVVVLSPEYAKSHMCLEELAKLCDMKSSLGHFILPIFYNVEPWHFGDIVLSKTILKSIRKDLARRRFMINEILHSLFRMPYCSV
ncbi:unnamed protein product [Cochlearia groenlandica]